MGWTGSAPNQTFTRTDGTRTGAQVHQEADNAGVKPSALHFDNTYHDMATALNLCWKRDGGNQPSADLPMNSKKFTGIGQGAARTDSLRIDQVQDGDLIYAGTVGGTADAIELTMSPTSGGPVEGMTVVFIAGADNTDATTVDLDGNGAVAVQWLGAALSGGEIRSGQTHSITYDGTQWQLNNPSLLGRLASTSSGQGAALIGVEDSNANLSATDAESAFDELATNLFAPSGTRMLFQQTSAPTGWTKDTSSVDNRALRVVSGTVGSGGNKTFTTVFATGYSTAGHALSESELPEHKHDVDSSGQLSINDPDHRHGYRETNVNNQGVDSAGSFNVNKGDTGGKKTNSESTGLSIGGETQKAGGNGAHSHNIDLDVQYIDVIVATKD